MTTEEKIRKAVFTCNNTDDAYYLVKALVGGKGHVDILFTKSFLDSNKAIQLRNEFFPAGYVESLQADNTPANTTAVNLGENITNY